MDAIFGSKLYKTSSRKAEITAAIKDPINMELVKQLRRYLDPEYLKPEYLGEEPKPEVKETADTKVVFDKSSPSSHPTPSFSSGSLSSELNTPVEDESSDENTSTDDVTEEPAKTEEDVLFDEPESESVEESISTAGLANITACQEIDSEVIKGTLNSREDCDGVARIAIRNDDTELWIYYKDSVNLNSVMESVIAFLENAGYTQLLFSRLARTDNAIVFDIVH